MNRLLRSAKKALLDALSIKVDGYDDRITKNTNDIANNTTAIANNKIAIDALTDGGGIGGLHKLEVLIPKFTQQLDGNWNDLTFPVDTLTGDFWDDHRTWLYELKLDCPLQNAEQVTVKWVMGARYNNMTPYSSTTLATTATFKKFGSARQSAEMDIQLVSADAFNETPAFEGLSFRVTGYTGDAVPATIQLSRTLIAE